MFSAAIPLWALLVRDWTPQCHPPPTGGCIAVVFICLVVCFVVVSACLLFCLFVVDWFGLLLVFWGFVFLGVADWCVCYLFVFGCVCLLVVVLCLIGC